MPRTSLQKALPPIEFRFTEPEDIGKYGDGWFTYDEASILRLPARQLIELESELNMPVTAVMNGFRQSSVLGDTAVAWLAVRATDPARAGEFDQFNPITMAIEWRDATGKPEPVAEAGQEDTPMPVESPSPTASGSLITTSAPTATVVLPSLPVAESSTSSERTDQSSPS